LRTYSQTTRATTSAKLPTDSGRDGSLPLGRHRIRHEGTELFIENIQPDDEGEGRGLYASQHHPVV